MQNHVRFQENAMDENMDAQVEDLCLCPHLLSNSSVGEHSGALQVPQFHLQEPQSHLTEIPWRTPHRDSPFSRQERSRIPTFRSLIIQPGSALDHALCAAREAFEAADRRRFGFLNFRHFLDALQYLRIDMAFHHMLHLFMNVDSDQDGLIIHSEFVEAYLRILLFSSNSWRV